MLQDIVFTGIFPFTSTSNTRDHCCKASLSLSHIPRTPQGCYEAPCRRSADGSEQRSPGLWWSSWTGLRSPAWCAHCVSAGSSALPGRAYVQGMSRARWQVQATLDCYWYSRQTGVPCCRKQAAQAPAVLGPAGGAQCAPGERRRNRCAFGVTPWSALGAPLFPSVKMHQCQPSYGCMGPQLRWRWLPAFYKEQCQCRRIWSGRAAA